MKKDDRLMISIFGGLEVRYGEKAIGVHVSQVKSNKMWALFAYFLLNQGRVITQDELIESLWPNMEVSNPANSLKVLIFKLRKEIDTLGFVAGKALISSAGGGYCFCSQPEMTMDLYQFDRYIQLGEKSDNPEDKLRQFLLAIKLYKGNIHQEMKEESWILPVQTHYAELYQKTIRAAVHLLIEKKEHEQIVKLCQNALLIQPYTEEYYYHMIQAYTALENYSAASDMYAEVKSVMNQVYGTTPDIRFEEAYRQLMKSRPKRNLSAEELTERFKEKDNYAASFYVEYGEFKQIYRLMARRLNRSKGEAFMCLYTLGIRRGAETERQERLRHLRILGEALGFGLRRGDVFTRVTPNQFAALFDGISEENTLRIAERIISYFEKHKQNENFGVLHKSIKIEPSEFEKRFNDKITQK